MNKSQHEIAVAHEEEELLMILKQADEYRKRKAVTLNTPTPQQY